MKCAQYITDFINYLSDNDVYIGWTAWAAGPFWGTSSPCCTDGKSFGSLEPDSLASDGSPGYVKFSNILRIITDILDS